MQPLARLRPGAALAGVLTDIDDTLTTDGRLTAAAYAALESLQRSGLRVVPVTGRPAGWCDHIARMWPVDAVVGENGAFYMAFDARARRLRTVYRLDDAARRARRDDLARIAQRVLAAVPGCALASDQPYRAADLAIDWCEDVPALPQPAVERIVALMRAEGLTVKVSSIHVNGWFGDYDKLATTRQCLAELWGINVDRDRDRWVFAGDSPNDAPMFGFFPNSVGMANVADFAGRIDPLPAYVTAARSGAGFVELAAHLLRQRPAPPPGAAGADPAVA
ncbi:MAG TPA: HAD-IIB family hydrolase [Burkholderiaceae bacterium]|nr:HAD-IIB family hydrolase [Burkholderiaceae bacterium]